MSDDFSKGAAKAAADMPHNKIVSSALPRALDVFPGGGARLNEFIDGYSSTHRAMTQDVHRVQNPYSVPEAAGGTQTPQTSVSTQGTRTMTADEQIMLLEDLKSYLNTFQERLLGVSENYQKKVDSLEGPILHEIHELFVNNELEPARQMISRLSALISDSSIPAVNRRIDQLMNIRDNG